MQKFSPKTTLKYIKLTLVALTILFTSGCNPFEPDHYDVFIYPNRNDLTNDLYVERYDSVAEARDVAQSYMKKYPNGDYEIGKNCTLDGICEETFN
ncbi:MAG: hypothetical protein L6406_20635 [Desulfobacterales bacterium]|nr:hypothetical protein [Desulfobacterales bacterium]